MHIMLLLSSLFENGLHATSRRLATGLFAAGLLTAPLPALAGLLHGNVQVSDGASADKNLGSANTSRNLAVGADGTIYSVYNSISGGIRVARSTDRGQTFQASVQVSATNAEAEITVSSSGIVYVAWISGGNALVSRSLDGGQTFAAPVTAGVASNSVHMATDASRVYLIDQGGNNFHASADHGQTFSPVAINASQVFSDVHVDPSNGNVIVQVDNPTVKYYVSTNQGASFGPQILPNPGGDIYFSVGALSSGSAGRYLFVAGGYFSSAAQSQEALRINLDTGTSETLTFGAIDSGAPQGRSLSADICGNVVDGYVSGGNVTFQISNDLGDTFGAATSVAATNSANVFINQTNGDVLFLYQVGGEVYLNVYNGELGNCYTPELNLSALTFGSQAVGSTSAAQDVIITNTGGADVQITGITATGDFAHAGGACVGTLAVGQSCTIPVTFTPTTAGTRMGQLQIQTNVFVNPRIVSLTGEGSGDAPAAAPVPVPTLSTWGVLTLGLLLGAGAAQRLRRKRD